MTRSASIDTFLGVSGVALAAAVGLISAHVSPDYRSSLYVLSAALAVIGVARMVRALRANLRHERALDELREGQAYLAQPAITRQIDTLFWKHDAAVKRDDLFRANFDYDSTRPGATVVTCKHCDWHITKALAYARDDAVRHYEANHVPPELARTRVRRMLRL